MEDEREREKTYLFDTFENGRKMVWIARIRQLVFEVGSEECCAPRVAARKAFVPRSVKSHHFPAHEQEPHSSEADIIG